MCQGFSGARTPPRLHADQATFIMLPRTEMRREKAIEAESGRDQHGVAPLAVIRLHLFASIWPLRELFSSSGTILFISYSCDFPSCWER